MLASCFTFFSGAYCDPERVQQTITINDIQNVLVHKKSFTRILIFVENY